MTKPKARVLNATAQQIAAISAVEDIRFWEKTRVEGNCLVWTGYRDKQGYGMVGRQSASPSPLLAHRYAYYLANGPYGNGIVIRHSCDNPLTGRLEDDIGQAIPSENSTAQRSSRTLRSCGSGALPGRAGARSTLPASSECTSPRSATSWLVGPGRTSRSTESRLQRDPMR